MIQVLVSTDMLLVLRLLYIFIAISGVVTSAYVGWDAQRDLRARQVEGSNGQLALVALINRRDALQVNGPLHLAFLSLGIYAVAFSHPIIYNQILSGEIFAVIFGAVQGSAVLTQLRNQRDRVSLRS